MTQKWNKLNQNIQSCQKCTRLIDYCKNIAKEKKRAFLKETYWGKPVSGFGDRNAELIIIGLAPAAHGANRTGRMFTGDNSGLWLYRALFQAGFSSHINSAHSTDSLKLNNAYITAAARCAPPQNKPSKDEFENCFTYLEQEWELLQNKKIFIALGKIAFDTLWKLIQIKEGLSALPKKPDFKHGKKIEYFSQKFQKKISIILSFHPSQQNTFTKKLTEPMFDSVFNEAIKTLKLNKNRR